MEETAYRLARLYAIAAKDYCTLAREERDNVAARDLCGYYRNRRNGLIEALSLQDGRDLRLELTAIENSALTTKLL